jgi:hypothetical protein
MIVKQSLEVAEIGAEIAGRNGRILPPCPGWLIKADPG